MECSNCGSELFEGECQVCNPPFQRIDIYMGESVTGIESGLNGVIEQAGMGDDASYPIMELLVTHMRQARAQREHYLAYPGVFTSVEVVMDFAESLDELAGMIQRKVNLRLIAGLATQLREMTNV